jgi:hypothetical protein
MGMITPCACEARAKNKLVNNKKNKLTIVLNLINFLLVFRVAPLGAIFTAEAVTLNVILSAGYLRFV